MDVGLSLASSLAGVPPTDLVPSIVERAAAARRAGLDSLHVGDKHGVSSPHAANIALAGHLSAAWPGTLGVLVISSMWNPVLLAEQVATLAASVRHLVVVAALGGGVEHFRGVGVPIRDRLPLFLDGLAVTRALLAGEEVTATVGPYDIQSARVALGGHVAMSWWIAANEPVAIERAARGWAGWTADGFLVSAKFGPSDVARVIDIYRNAGGTGRVVVRREVFVGATSAEVERLAEPIVVAGHRGYADDAIIRGTTPEVIEEVGFLADLGVDELLVRSLVPDQSAAIGSIERLADVRRQLRP